MKKLISLIMIAATLAASLMSCSKDNTPAVMTYGDTVITEAMYKYYVATYKSRYTMEYNGVVASDKFYTSDVGGMTGEEYMRDLIYKNVANNLVAAEKFRAAGLTLTKAQTDSVDQRLQDMINDFAEGSRKIFNGQLSEFGINADILRNILIMEKQAYAYYEYLYGDGGTVKLSDEQRDEYFKENYVRFDRIVIYSKHKYVTDENGEILQDTSGNYQVRDLTDEEKADAAERIAAVKAGIEAGEDFAELKKKYSDSKEYDTGLYFPKTANTDSDAAVIREAFAISDGETSFLSDANDNCVFFIKRLPLVDGAYKDEKMQDFFLTFEEGFTADVNNKMLAEAFPDIEKNDELINGISVKDSPANYYYY